MRKLVLVFAICITVLGSSALWANASLLLKGGMELGGKYSLHFEGDSSPEVDVDPSFTLGAEILGQSSENFEIGAGIMFQMNRTFANTVDYDDKYEDDEEPKFRYLPIYGLIRLSQRGTGIYRFGGIAQLGFSPMMGNDAYSGNIDLKGGLYFGIGGFMHFTKEMYAEVMYRVCNGGVESYGETLTIRTSNIGIMLGYRLPM